MGWEMLPPEQPVWVSRCCPNECVKEREALQQRLANSEEGLSRCLESKTKIRNECLQLESERDELQRRCESYKAAYDAIMADLKIMEKKLSDLKAERNRLKAENKRLHEELAKSRAERNEYFVALSKIANNPVYGVEVIELVTIAKAALRRNGE